MTAQLTQVHLLATGPVEWLMNEIADKLFGCSSPDDTNNCRDGIFGVLFGSDVSDPRRYDALYGAVQVCGLMLAACAAAARVIRMLSDPRTGGGHLLLDTTVRFALAVLLIGPGTRPGDAPGLALLHWSLDTSVAMAVGLNHAFTSAHPVLELPGWGTDVFLAAAKGVARMFGGKLGFIGVLSLAVSLLLVLYLGVLFIARLVLVAVCIATAPVCIALAVFDTRNRFFEWWLDTLAGSLFIPLVIFPAIGIVFSLAGSGGIFQNIVFTPLILMGGLWITGKAVHRLTWRHFQHGGPVGALTAGLTGAWMAPELAFEAFTSARALGLRGGRGIYGLPSWAGGRAIDTLVEASSRKQAAVLAAADIDRWKLEDAGVGGVAPVPEDAMRLAGLSGFDGLSPSNRQAVATASAGHGGPGDFERFLDDRIRPGIRQAEGLNPNEWVGEYLNSLPGGGSRSGGSMRPEPLSPVSPVILGADGQPLTSSRAAYADATLSAVRAGR